MVTIVGKGNTTSIWWGEARDVVKHSTGERTALPDMKAISQPRMSTAPTVRSTGLTNFTCPPSLCENRLFCKVFLLCQPV